MRRNAESGVAAIFDKVKFRICKMLDEPHTSLARGHAIFSRENHLVWAGDLRRCLFAVLIRIASLQVGCQRIGYIAPHDIATTGDHRDDDWLGFWICRPSAPGTDPGQFDAGRWPYSYAAQCAR